MLFVLFILGFCNAYANEEAFHIENEADLEAGISVSFFTILNSILIQLSLIIILATLSIFNSGRPNGHKS